MSGHNMAFSVNKDAITGVYPDFSIDYSKVLLSQGGLFNADAPAAASTVAGKLVFTWTDNSDGENELISDTAFVAAYNPETKRWVQKQKAATRNAGTFTLICQRLVGNRYKPISGLCRQIAKKLPRACIRAS